MKDDFDRWNQIKKDLEISDTPPLLLPREREVWMCSLGKNLGFEQNGSGDNFSRPALIVKKFNNKMFWVVPLSSKQKPYDFYFNFTDPDGQKVSAILAQLRLLSTKRFRRVLYELPVGTLKQYARALPPLYNRSPAYSGASRRLRNFRRDFVNLLYCARS